MGCGEPKATRTRPGTFAKVPIQLVNLLQARRYKTPPTRPGAILHVLASSSNNSAVRPQRAYAGTAATLDVIDRTWCGYGTYEPHGVGWLSHSIVMLVA